MPRDLPIGNGKILINFDKEYHMRDVYYPHVGQENHTIGHVSRFGVWVDGQFSWVGAGWDIRRNYLKETLVTDVLLHNTDLGLDIRVHDVVDYHMDLLVREVHVTNLKDTPRKVRLFFHHDFHISENEVGDTAYFDPRTTSVIHYKKHRWFLTKTQGSNHYGVSMWSIGNKEVNGCEGTWKDAEDGELGRNAIAQGSVDSTVACELDIPPRAEETGYLWMAFGTNYEEVAKIVTQDRRSVQTQFACRSHADRQRWCDHCGQRSRHRPVCSRHIFIYVAARRGACGLQFDPRRLSRYRAAFLQFLY
jgi:GH15 family glucan-1,4-alpha-glucosidase